MLETLLLILGIEESDKTSISILNYYITKATQYFLNETNLEAMPVSAGDIIIDLVILMWNKRGSEGLSSENHSGISYSWLDDIPMELKRQLVSYRVITW
ncbi:phage head-tail connector protein [Clostridium massiliamazoniense]|uniref:phage head-tail connector protein n=1 Tax=Clostridium massiliamazoniense TaxID=1347366 RepID=UPI0006D7759D|nr:phage head-tail connector protein [Clostridium massiliamazoniense]